MKEKTRERDIPRNIAQTSGYGKDRTAFTFWAGDPFFQLKAVALALLRVVRLAAERKDCPKGWDYPLDLHEKNLSCLHNPKIFCIFAATDSATLPIRTANQGGTSFLYTFMNYTKQPLDYHQIIAQLKSRGLLFHNEDVAISQLQIISYFRIANYLKSFEVVGFNHVFLPNSFFEDALDLYYFDKKLRNLLFTAIQSIEVALRSKVIHNVSLRHGAF